MAKKVIWSERAVKERKQILLYWNTRNGSKIYSLKLNILFKEAVGLIKEYPEIGRRTNSEYIRVKVVRDYLIFYENKNEVIFILSIFDCRQNPEKFKNLRE